MTRRELHDLYGLLADAPPDNMRPRWNGAPTQDFAACRLDSEGRRIASRLRWGLIPFWAKDAKNGSRMINARAETVDSKPTFRSAFRTRRCLVPADEWFEWVRDGGGKSPRFLSMADGSIASFAGLWERWEGPDGLVESFSIMTTEASPELAHVHARQPAVVDPNQFDDWLAPDSPEEMLLGIVRPPHPGPYEVKPVSRRVNDVRNDGPEVLGSAKSFVPIVHSHKSDAWGFKRGGA